MSNNTNANNKNNDSLDDFEIPSPPSSNGSLLSPLRGKQRLNHTSPAIHYLEAKKKQKKRLQQQAASKAHLRYNQAILKANNLLDGHGESGKELGVDTDVNSMENKLSISISNSNSMKYSIWKWIKHFTENENEVIIVFLKKQQHPISATDAAHNLAPKLQGRSVKQIYKHLQNKQGTIYKKKISDQYNCHKKRNKRISGKNLKYQNLMEIE